MFVRSAIIKIIISSQPSKIDNAMSRNTQFNRSITRTPILKRNIFQQMELKSHPLKSNISQSIMRHKVSFLQKVQSSTISSQVNGVWPSCQLTQFSNVEQMDSVLEERVVEMTKLFQACFNEDTSRSIRLKEKKSYNHHYEQKESFGQIQVNEPCYIPEIVQKKYQKKLYQDQTINFIQGFLPEIGFLYYVVGNQIFFFDAEKTTYFSLPAHKQNIFYGKNMLSLYHIQILTIGKPFYRQNKSVMIFLHPYRAQIYEYTVVVNHDKKTQKHINIEAKHSHSCFNLPLIKPNKLQVDRNGTILCTDDEGNLFKIDSDLNYNKKQLEMAKLSDLWSACTSKLNGFGLSRMYNSVTKYAKNLFLNKKVSSCLIIVDEAEKIVLVVVKKKQISRDGSIDKIQQFLLVHDIQSLEILYRIQQHSLLNKKPQEILSCIRLETKFNNSFNFAFLLSSGKRIHTQINRKSLSKKQIFRQLPIEDKEKHQKPHSANINAFIFSDRVLMLLAQPNKRKLIMARQSCGGSEEVLKIVLFERQNRDDEMASEFYLFARSNNYIGCKKQFLVQCQSSSVAIQQMQILSQQTFYRPLEIYYANDRLFQKIRILRPIDTFFTLFINYHYSSSLFLKYIKQVMPSTTTEELISFCCQIYCDTQGLYYQSKAIIAKLQTEEGKSYVASGSLGKKDSALGHNGVAIEHRYTAISKEHSQRLRMMMLRLSCESKVNREESARIVIKGIFKYFCKILRHLWSANINDLSAETSKTGILYLKELATIVQELRTHCSQSKPNQLIFQITKRWVDKFVQLLILIGTVPNMPQINMYQALSTNSQIFDPHLFSYLIRQANSSLFYQLSKKIPYYVSRQFTRVYKLHCEIQRIEKVEDVLKICRQQRQLPHYLVDYLAEVRRIPEAYLLSKRKIEDIVVVSQFSSGEDVIKGKIEKIKQSSEYDIGQKEVELFKVSLLINNLLQESSIREQVFNQYNARICEIQSQLKIQKLIVESYQKRNNGNRQEGRWQIAFQNVFSNITLDGGRYTLNSKERGQPKEDGIMYILNNTVFPIEQLRKLVVEIGDPFVQIVFDYYYSHHSFREELGQYLRGQRQKGVDFDAFSEGRKLQLFKLRNSINLSQQKDQLYHILQIYMNQLLAFFSPTSEMWIKNQLQRTEMYWFYHYCAEIGLDVQQLYMVGSNQLCSILSDDRGVDFAEKYVYNLMSCYYMVRQFLPERKKQFEKYLKVNEEGALFKQAQALILS